MHVKNVEVLFTLYKIFKRGGDNNCSTDKKTRSKSNCGSYVGIDKDKTKLLAKIVKETDAILVLSSSWKIGWEPKGDYNKESVYNYHAKYLDNHLKKKGGLVLQDKTRERNLDERGMGIKAYLILHPKITNWIVLDDEIFADFQIRGIMPHLVKVLNKQAGPANKERK